MPCGRFTSIAEEAEEDMRERQMRRLLKFVGLGLAAGLLFMAIVPLGAVALLGEGGVGGLLKARQGGGGTDAQEAGFAGKVKLPKTIDVWIEEKGKVVSVDFEDYVTRVVASEMPYTFDLEALKAQSVAARTFSAAKLEKYAEKKPKAHPKAPVCNTTHCQVYKTEKALIDCHEKGWADKGWPKIQKACKATRGQLLYYEGEMVMQPLFFSSSGGQTENSEDVFVGAYPYLVSVSSPYEAGASHAQEEKTISLEMLRSQLNASYPERAIGKLSAKKIKILNRTAGGRVNEMQIGSATFKGTEVRTALGLSSTLFSISFADGQITFTSDGYGHGVGMSQYGANGMAKKGYNYKEILTHYYSGTEIS